MPIVGVKMLTGRTPEQKRALVREITDALVRTIDTTTDQVNVLIEEYEPDHWAFGGEFFSDRRARTTSTHGGGK